MELIDRMRISDKTKETYGYVYKRHPIDPTQSQDDIIEQLKEVKLSDRVLLVSIIKSMRKMLKLADDRVDFYSMGVVTEYKLHLRNKNIKLERSLPSHEVILEYCDQCYRNCLNKGALIGDFKRFIINRLLLTTNCRNLDLVLSVTEKTSNYLEIDGNAVIFSRSEYKTYSTYGTKSVILHDERLKQVLEMWLKKYSSKLGDKKYNTLINFPQCVNFYTYDRIGEGSYFKICVKKLIENNDTEKLNELSVLRGVNTATILEYYDLQNKV